MLCITSTLPGIDSVGVCVCVCVREGQRASVFVCTWHLECVEWVLQAHDLVVHVRLMGLDLVLQAVVLLTQLVHLRQGDVEPLAQLSHQALKLWCHADKLACFPLFFSLWCEPWIWILSGITTVASLPLDSSSFRSFCSFFSCKFSAPQSCERHQTAGWIAHLLLVADLLSLRSASVSRVQSGRALTFILSHSSGWNQPLVMSQRQLKPHRCLSWKDQPPAWSTLVLSSSNHRGDPS